MPMATHAEIETFCQERLSSLLDIETSRITPETTFASLGLDSAMAVHFVLEAEDWFGVELYPAVTADYPTVGAFAGHLAQLLA